MASGPYSTSDAMDHADSLCGKELQIQAAFAKFFLQAGVPSSAANTDSFKEMCESLARYGPNYEPPSYDELRGPLLKKEVKRINWMINVHKKEWSKNGCSIIFDAWMDSEQQTIINMFVNSSKGTVFMKSVDASSFMKSDISLSGLLDMFVERIGEANVVQVITDNNINSVLAGKLLMVARPNLFWTPCVAHSIDLMLEDIGNIAKVKTTIKRAIFLVGYIYNDGDVLDMMREFTENKELPRTGITRFVTTYLTLFSLHKQKACLKNMFESEKWTKSKWAKEAKGKKANEIASMPSFWNNVIWILKVMRPLVQVLRLVKNEKKPAMGYIYKAMDKAKEAIRSALDKDADCKVVFDIIDKRWECQVDHPLHAAGYYLNPELYCSNPAIKKDSKVMKGLIVCVEKLVPRQDKQHLIRSELIKWVEQTGLFSNDLAIRARGKMAPVKWWKLFGSDVPNVQEFAIKVLSLTCSSSYLKRDLSRYEHINFKEDNKSDEKKMIELEFARYNLRLKSCRNKDEAYDSISLEDIDYCNEWLIGEMEEDQAEMVNVANANGSGDDDNDSVEEDFDSDDEGGPFLGDDDYDYGDD